jgi:site-specific recombinase XerC
MFEFANRMGWREGTNPALALPAAKVRRQRPAILDAAQLQSLLCAASPAISPQRWQSVRLLAFGGQRSSVLDWKDVKLARGFIDVGGETAKTGRRRLGARSESLAAWLGFLRTAERSCCAFGVLLQSALYEAREKAGLKDEWSGNELRHSYASARLAETRNAALVAEELGNSVAIVRAHYAEVLTQEEAAAFFAVLPGTPKNVVKMRAA